MEEINPSKLLTQVTEVLDKLEIPYFITGGFAVSVWGRPRATFDIDIVVNLIEPEVPKLAEMLRGISEFGYIDENTAKEAIKTNGEFNFIDPDTGVKADFWVARDDEMAKEEYRRIKKKEINGQEVCFISPEDLILSKLRWYKISPSSRHLEDVESILKISGDILDKKYLLKQARKQGTWDTLNKYLN
ncbi:hypothetical protein A3H85_00920 [Candidatus Daviesbacteria bacterium RIFCSPLOWO2_02_FULL_40_8]|nr:MAG: hypothetical protein A3H85_00920 [Candidatus Daviesbacteria bacterium RIFCSPLOWO2_02_FULL_40_8]